MQDRAAQRARHVLGLELGEHGVLDTQQVATLLRHEPTDRASAAGQSRSTDPAAAAASRVGARPSLAVSAVVVRR